MDNYMNISLCSTLNIIGVGVLLAAWLMVTGLIVVELTFVICYWGLVIHPGANVQL